MADPSVWNGLLLAQRLVIERDRQTDVDDEGPGERNTESGK